MVAAKGSRWGLWVCTVQSSSCPGEKNAVPHLGDLGAAQKWYEISRRTKSSSRKLEKRSAARKSRNTQVSLESCQLEVRRCGSPRALKNSGLSKPSRWDQDLAAVCIEDGQFNALRRYNANPKRGNRSIKGWPKKNPRCSQMVLLESKEGALRDPCRVGALIQRQVDPVHLLNLGPELSGVFF